jgi:hypothetical protein
MEVLEEVVGQSLGDVRSIKLQSHEHDTREYHDSHIDLPD